MYHSDSDEGSDDFVSVTHHEVGSVDRVGGDKSPTTPASYNWTIPVVLRDNQVFAMPFWAGKLIHNAATSNVGFPLTPTEPVRVGLGSTEAAKFISNYTGCVVNVSRDAPQLWERLQLRLLECTSANPSECTNRDESEWTTLSNLLDERDRILAYLSGSSDLLLDVLELAHAIDNKPLFLLCSKMLGERVRHAGAVSDELHPWRAMTRNVGGGGFHDDHYLENYSMTGPMPAGCGGDLFSSITSSFGGFGTRPPTNPADDYPQQHPLDGLIPVFSSANDTQAVHATNYYGHSFSSAVRLEVGTSSSFKRLCERIHLDMAGRHHASEAPSQESVSTMLDTANALAQVGSGGSVILSSRARVHKSVALMWEEQVAPLTWQSLPAPLGNSAGSGNDSWAQSSFLGAAFNFPLASVPVRGGHTSKCIRSPFGQRADSSDVLCTTTVSNNPFHAAAFHPDLVQVAHLMSGYSSQCCDAFRRVVFPHVKEHFIDEIDVGAPAEATPASPNESPLKSKPAGWKQHAAPVESPLVGPDGQSPGDVGSLIPLPPNTMSLDEPANEATSPVISRVVSPPTCGLNHSRRPGAAPVAAQWMVSLVAGLPPKANLTTKPISPPPPPPISPPLTCQLAPTPPFFRGAAVDVEGYVKSVQVALAHGILKERVPDRDLAVSVDYSASLMRSSPAGMDMPPQYVLRPWEEQSSSRSCPTYSHHLLSTHCRVCGKAICAQCSTNQVGFDYVAVLFPVDRDTDGKTNACIDCSNEVNRKKKWEFLWNAVLNSGLSLPEVRLLRPVSLGWRYAADFIFFKVQQLFRRFDPVCLEDNSPDLRPLLLQSAWAFIHHPQPALFLVRCICWPLLYDAVAAHEMHVINGNNAMQEAGIAVPAIVGKALPSLSPCGPSVAGTSSIAKRMHAIAFNVLLATCDGMLRPVSRADGGGLKSPSSPTEPTATPTFHPQLIGCTVPQENIPRSWFGCQLLSAVRDIPAHPTTKFTMPKTRMVAVPEPTPMESQETLPQCTPIGLLHDRCVELICSGLEASPNDPLENALSASQIPLLFDLLSCPAVRPPVRAALRRLAKASQSIQAKAIIECASRVDTFSPSHHNPDYIVAQRREATPPTSYVGGVMKYVKVPNASLFGSSLRLWSSASTPQAAADAGTSDVEAVLSQWEDIVGCHDYYAWSRDQSPIPASGDKLVFLSIRSILKQHREAAVAATVPRSLRHFFAYSTKHMVRGPPLLPHDSYAAKPLPSPIIEMLRQWHRDASGRARCYFGLHVACKRVGNPYPIDEFGDDAPIHTTSDSPQPDLLSALVTLGHDLHYAHQEPQACEPDAIFNTMKRMLAFTHLLDLLNIAEPFTPALSPIPAPPRADAGVESASLKGYWSEPPSPVLPPCSLYDLLHTDKHGVIFVNRRSQPAATTNRKQEATASPKSTGRRVQDADTQMIMNQKSEVYKLNVRLVELLREFALTDESGTSGKTAMGAVERLGEIDPNADIQVHPFVYPFCRASNAPILITAIRLGETKIFADSKQRPCRLTLVDQAGGTHSVLYKRESLRNDTVVANSIHCLQHLLYRDNVLDPSHPLPTYQVLPTGAHSGLIEIHAGLTTKELFQKYGATQKAMENNVSCRVAGPRLLRHEHGFTDTKQKSQSVADMSKDGWRVRNQAMLLCREMHSSDLGMLALAGWNYLGGGEDEFDEGLYESPQLPLPPSVVALDCFASVLRPTQNPIISYLSQIVFDRCETRYRAHLRSTREYVMQARDAFSKASRSLKTPVPLSAIAEEEAKFHRFLLSWFVDHPAPPPLPPTYQQDEERRVASQFLSSVMYSAIVQYTFRVGDRHEKNVMFDPSGSRFDIDFGFVYGDKPLADITGGAVRFEPDLKTAVCVMKAVLSGGGRAWYKAREDEALGAFEKCVRQEWKGRGALAFGRHFDAKRNDAHASLLSEVTKRFFVSPPVQPFGSLCQTGELIHTPIIRPERLATFVSGETDSEVVSYTVTNSTAFGVMDKPVKISLPSVEEDKTFVEFLHDASRLFVSARRYYHVLDSLGAHLANCGRSTLGHPFEVLVAKTALHDRNTRERQRAMESAHHAKAHRVSQVTFLMKIQSDVCLELKTYNETGWARGSGWGCGGSIGSDNLIEAVTGLRYAGQTEASVRQHRDDHQTLAVASFTSYSRSPFHNHVFNKISSLTAQPHSQSNNRESPTQELSSITANAKVNQLHPHDTVDDAGNDHTDDWEDGGGFATPTFIQKRLLIGIEERTAAQQFATTVNESVKSYLIRDLGNHYSSAMRSLVK